PRQESRMVIAIGILAGLLAGAGAVLLFLRTRGAARLGEAERTRRLVLEEADREAGTIRREAQGEARETALRLRGELESDLHTRRTEAVQREERLRAQDQDLERRRVELERREQGIADRETHLRQLQEEAKQARDRELKELERIAGLTVGE